MIKKRKKNAFVCLEAYWPNGASITCLQNITVVYRSTSGSGSCGQYHTGHFYFPEHYLVQVLGWINVVLNLGLGRDLNI